MRIDTDRVPRGMLSLANEITDGWKMHDACLKTAILTHLNDGEGLRHVVVTKSVKTPSRLSMKGLKSYIHSSHGYHTLYLIGEQDAIEQYKSGVLEDNKQQSSELAASVA